MLELTFEVTEEDFIKYYCYQKWTAANKKGLRIGLHVLFGFLFLSLFLTNTTAPLFQSQNLFWLAIGGLFLVYLPILIQKFIAYLARRQYKITYPDGFKPSIFKANPTQIEIHNSDGSLTILLKQVKKLEELEELFLLYLKNSETIILAQQNFQTRSEYDHFVETISDWVFIAN